MSNLILSNEQVKHLCEFMGIRPIRYSDTSYSWRDGVNFGVHEDDYYKCMSSVWRYVGERKVNDWGFVMSVVEKIESIEDGERGRKYNVQIEQDFVVIVDNHSGDEILDIDGEDKLSAVVCGCVGFIMWYVRNEGK